MGYIQPDDIDIATGPARAIDPPQAGIELFAAGGERCGESPFAVTRLDETGKNKSSPNSTFRRKKTKNCFTLCLVSLGSAKMTPEMGNTVAH
jgi:hypothetical protein